MTFQVNFRKGSNNPALKMADQDQYAGAALGFNCLNLQAAAALLIGDAVYVTAAGKVDKSATVGDYATFAGIVVGGPGAGSMDQLSFSSSNLGLAACAADQYVYVAVTGVVWAIASAGIVRGTRVGIGATAGRVDDGAASNKFATCLDTATNAADPVRLLLNGIG